MLRRVFQTIRDRGLFHDGARLVVGVSGGADSVALLHALHARMRRDRLHLLVAHLHHGIRGKAADEDARFVQRLAWRLGLPCVVEYADVPDRSRRARESIEMAARAERQTFFASVCRAHRADAVALAHTADDAAETLLLRLLRGSGTFGLGGLAAESRVGSLRIIRPLIDVTRAEVEAFLRAHGLEWREDATNRDLSIPRNRVRRELIPLLQSHYQPNICRVLVRTAEALRADAALLEPMIRRTVARAASKTGALAIPALRREPSALRRHVIQRWLRAHNVPESRIDADAIARVEALVVSGAGRVDIASGLMARIRGQALEIAPTRSNWTPRIAPLPVPGVVVWGDDGLRVEAEPWRGILRVPPGVIGQAPAMATIRLPEEGEQLAVRPPWPGARLAPTGMRGSVKLQDLFVNHRVPRADRPSIPVVACGDEVVWVPGHRVARAWAVSSESGPCIRLRLLR